MSTRRTRTVRRARIKGRTVVTGAGLATALVVSGAGATGALAAPSPGPDAPPAVVLTVPQADGSAAEVTFLPGTGRGATRAEQVVELTLL